MSITQIRKTPKLTIDLNKVAELYGEIHALLPMAEIHYAMKCNPLPDILRTIDSLGGSFEIASGSELQLLEDCELARPESLLYSNPVKPIEDIEYTYQRGVRLFAFDSENEIEKFTKVAPGAGVYIRLAALSHTSIVDSEGKFGVSGEDAYDLVLKAKEAGLNPQGISFHVGSQMLDTAAWQYTIEHAANLMAKLQHAGVTLSFLDIGGGFPARYDDVPNGVLKETAVVIRECLQRLPYEVKVIVEPGRYLVAEAGVIEAQVIGLSERFGKRWAYLNIGAFNGLIEALETRNQLLFPMWDSKKSDEKASYTVTGPTCDSQDTVRHDVGLSEDLAVGDTVFIGCAGAYTNAYTGIFNGFEPPAIHTMEKIGMEE